MANIILDSRKLMVYEDLKYLCEYTGKKPGFCDSLWNELLKREALYEEFLFYIDNHCINDKLSVSGYSITDLYVYMLGRFNLLNDTGKNTAACSRDSVILDCFSLMAELMDNPEETIKRLEAGGGMDLL